MPENSNDFSSMLSRVLSDPDAMARIGQLAKSLGGEGTPSDNTGASDGDKNQNDSPHIVQNASDDTVQHSQDKPSDSMSHNAQSFSDDSAQNAQIPLKLPAGAAAALSHGLNKKENDQRIALLCALKPYLGDERRGKVDEILKLMRLLSLTDLGALFK